MRIRWRTLRGVILALVGVTAAAELSLRVAAAFPSDSRCWVTDAQTGFRFRPRSHCGVGANALGFLDVEHAVEKAPGTTRLAFVGDSFVAGSVDPPDTFVSLTQRQAEAAGRRLEVLNLGLTGAGPRNYLGVIRAEAQRLNVDAICLMVFLGNDVTQAHPDFWTTTWLGGPHETLRRPYLMAPSLRYFYAARTARLTWRSLYDRWFADPDSTFSQATYFSLEQERMEIYARQPSAFVQAAYAGAVELVGTIAAEAAANHITLTVVLAPDELQVNTGLRSAVAKAYSLDLSQYDFKRPNVILTRALETLRVPVLDVLPALEAEASQDVYFKYNTHWNERGNRVVAEVLWPFLLAHGGLNR